jgi:hypothetical protein
LNSSAINDGGARVWLSSSRSGSARLTLARRTGEFGDQTLARGPIQLVERFRPSVFAGSSSIAVSPGA